MGFYFNFTSKIEIILAQSGEHAELRKSYAIRTLYARFEILCMWLREYSQKTSQSKTSSGFLYDFFMASLQKKKKKTETYQNLYQFSLALAISVHISIADSEKKKKPTISWNERKNELLKED